MVKVRRIVADFAVDDLAEMAAFYRALFDLDVLMDQGWIVTLGTDTKAQVQISLASQGGSGAPVPDVSIEVDDLDEVHARALQVDAQIIYPLTEEPWGVRRFFVRDPADRVINVLTHI
jgi:predicted enzyme related to lactoylglutathione lyase